VFSVRSIFFHLERTRGTYGVWRETFVPSYSREGRSFYLSRFVNNKRRRLTVLSTDLELFGQRVYGRCIIRTKKKWALDVYHEPFQTVNGFRQPRHAISLVYLFAHTSGASATRWLVYDNKQMEEQTIVTDSPLIY